MLLMLLGSLREDDRWDLDVVETHHSRVPVDLEAAGDPHRAKDRSGITLRHRDRRARLETVVLPGVELRLIHRDGRSFGLHHPRPRLPFVRVLLPKTWNCRSQQKGQDQCVLNS